MCETFKGVNFVVYWWWMQRKTWGAKIKKWGRCQFAIAQLLCVASLVFPPFSVFKFVYHEHPLHFLLLLCQSCRSLRNVSFGGDILGLIKSAYHGWLSMMTSSEGPLCSLASSNPTLNPPLVRGPKPSQVLEPHAGVTYLAILKSIFCWTDFGSTTVLDLQQKLKTFQKQMAMRSFLGFIALLCSSEVLFAKLTWFLAFLWVYFSDVYILMPDQVAAIKNIVLSIWLTVRKLLFYSNPIFYGPNKHNPFSGHTVYLCRFSVVIFQASQNIVF